MKQKISAMYYIKNNKRRVSVLIVSLSLFIIMMYLSMFILSSTSESFKSLLIETPKKTQFIELSSPSLGIKNVENLSKDEFIETKKQKYLELAQKLEKQKGVDHVFLSQSITFELNSVVGTYYKEYPSVDADDVEVVMSHMNATLKEGRLPKNSGEIIMDEKLIKNNDFKIGDEFQSGNMKIVGIASCDDYFACAVKIDAKSYASLTNLVILSDGSISDFTSLLNDMGYTISKDDSIIDCVTSEKSYKEDVGDAINTPFTLIYNVITVVLSVCLIAVYSIYLRDRYSEWCLYSSIGFSNRQIYFSIIRELLFTYVLSIIIGVAVCSVSMILIDNTLISSLGLMCKYLNLDIIIKILTSNIIIFALLQIPIRFALYKVRTIDAIDDDLI